MEILIIKIRGLGDVVRTTFLAQALKQKYNSLHPRIVWLTQRAVLPIFLNNPYVDEVKILEERDQFKGRQFDLVINLEEDEENCKFASAVGKEIIGFYYHQGKIVPSPSAREWFDMSALGEKPRNNLLKKKNAKKHRQILSEVVGVQAEKYEPFIRLTDKQRLIAQKFLRRHNLSHEDLIIGINTGGADRWPKSLPLEKTIALIEHIYQKVHPKILLFGGPNEVERNTKILQKTRAPIIDTGCGNDLFEFPALISVCNVFITTDSLGLHIALALKRKTIALIGPTSAAEIDMYGLGEKVVAKSSCVCCYTKTCKSMERIHGNEVVRALERLLKEKITVIITAYQEPRIGKAVEAALHQKTRYSYDVVVSAPDEETLRLARAAGKNDPRLKTLKDPGKGKSYALNMVLQNMAGDLLILTDGDIWISENALEELVTQFKDPEIGCAGGRPVARETRATKYGYWANFLFEAAHRLRKEAFQKHRFLECSGYLFAFRKKKIEKIPLDVAEDALIPYYFWEKGYRIGYAEKAEVYLKNVENYRDWMKQKTRTSKAHETLSKYVDIKTTPRVKTFLNEAGGIFWASQYPQTLKEMIWTLELIAVRLTMWLRVYVDTRLREKHYTDAWERAESAR